MSELILGLTGGVASGKSEVERRFAALGITVADADKASREALAAGSDGLDEVIAAFGREVLDSSGQLDRPAMRRRIFADDQARRTLESIVHPRVRISLLAQCRAAMSPYAIAAIPLLVESGRDAYPWLDRILVIDVPVEMQRNRLLVRDGIDEALADRIIASQASRQQRLAIADEIIVNDGPLDTLDAHVARLHRHYLALASGADTGA